MKTTVALADIAIALETELPLTVSEAFQPFLTQRQADFSAEFTQMAALPELRYKPLYNGPTFDVVQSGNGCFYRRFYDEKRDSLLYAVSHLAPDTGKVQVQYRIGSENHLNHLSGALFHIGLEKLLLAKERLILHASCVETGFGGILFSGPSGIGKSTQGDLWCQTENAVLLNGDRPILGKDGGKWMAYGSPYAGSSHCHINRSTPVRALVMLRQAPDCSIRVLPAAQAFRRIMEQVTTNIWDASFVSAACALVAQFMEDIPVYELSATPDARAVQLLKETLHKENIT